MATFKVLLDKRREPNEEGYPLVIRVYSGNGRRDIGLKTYLKESEFDETTIKVVGKHPNKKLINQKIQKAILDGHFEPALGGQFHRLFQGNPSFNANKKTVLNFVARRGIRILKERGEVFTSSATIVERFWWFPIMVLDKSILATISGVAQVADKQRYATKQLARDVLLLIHQIIKAKINP